MTLPEGFSEWEHLQTTIKRVFNRLIREEFSDIGGDDWEPDISIPRGSLRHACTLKDNDTVDMEILRMMLYYFVIGKARDLQSPVFAYPIEEIEAVRKYKPQICFYFEEDAGDVEEDYAPVRGQISYRLVNEQNNTITKSELTAIANRIKTQFGVGQGYVWRKGKDMATYVDRAKGYDFQILCRSKSDAKELIDKVLATNNDQPDWQYLQYKENEQPSTAYPTFPGTQIIFSKTYRKPRRRPIASVRFQYAYCKVWGMNKAIYLYDKSFRYFDALVD